MQTIANVATVKNKIFKLLIFHSAIDEIYELLVVAENERQARILPDQLVTNCKTA